MNEADFKQWLAELAFKVNQHGLVTLVELSHEEFELFESSMNDLISSDKPETFDDNVRIRYLFRIFHKYERDIRLGVKSLNKHHHVKANT